MTSFNFEGNRNLIGCHWWGKKNSWVRDEHNGLDD